MGRWVMVGSLPGAPMLGDHTPGGERVPDVIIQPN